MFCIAVVVNTDTRFEESVACVKWILGPRCKYYIAQVPQMKVGSRRRTMSIRCKEPLFTDSLSDANKTILTYNYVDNSLVRANFIYIPFFCIMGGKASKLDPWASQRPRSLQVVVACRIMIQFTALRTFICYIYLAISLSNTSAPPPPLPPIPAIYSHR